MSSNMQRLGDTLASRMKKSASAAIPTTLELGTVNNNLSITTDSIDGQIPKGSYMVNLILSSDTYQTSSETHTHSGGEHSQDGGSGAHSHDGGAHSHSLPGVFRGLRAGDRVLVAWCGHEPVVIAVVVSS